MYEEAIRCLLDSYLSRHGIYVLVKERAALKLKLFQLDKPKHVYSVKARVKDAQSLRRKLEMKAKKSELDPTLGLDEQVHDVVGLRIVRYSRSDLPAIHMYVSENFSVRGIEVYYVDNQIIDYLQQNVFSADEWKRFEDNNDDNYRKVDAHDDEKVGRRGYSAIHYAARLSDGNSQDVPIEIQVRDVFEEAWGELQHDVSYKHPRVGHQQYFSNINTRLAQCSRDLELVIETIQTKTVEALDLLAGKLPSSIAHEEEVLEILVDSGVEIDSTAFGQRVAWLDSLNGPYASLLQHKSGLNGLRTLLTHPEDDQALVLQAVKLDLIRSMCEVLAASREGTIDPLLLAAVQSVPQVPLVMEKQEFLKLCAGIDYSTVPSQITKAIGEAVSSIWSAGETATAEYIPVLVVKLWIYLDSEAKENWIDALTAYLSREDSDPGVVAAIYKEVRGAPYLDSKFESLRSWRSRSGEHGVKA